MNKIFEEKAQRLAGLNWSIDVFHDSDSEDFPYVASVRELDGCMAQGIDKEEALGNLEDAKFDYLYSLLEDGLSVPSPIAPCNTSTSSGLSYIISEHAAECIADQSDNWVVFDKRNNLIVSHS